MARPKGRKPSVGRILLTLPAILLGCLIGGTVLGAYLGNAAIGAAIGAGLGIGGGACIVVALVVWGRLLDNL